jgi:hypothetical protein
MNFYPYFTYLANFGDIRHRSSTHNTAEQLRGAWKSIQEKKKLSGFLEFSFDLDKIRLVKRYQILAVKNVLVKSVYRVMEYTISSLVSVPLLLSCFLYYLAGVMIPGEVV